MTILVLTQPRDFTADLVIQAIADRAPVARMDTADFPQRMTITATGTGYDWHGTMRTPYRSVDLGAIRAVYYRRPGPYELPDGMSDSERQWAAAEARYGVRGVLASLPVRWVNHPDRTAAAEYKPFQLAAAAKAGLAVPRTLITNDPSAVRAFAADCRDGIVYKSLSGSPDDLLKWAIYTRAVDPDADLSGIQHTAHLVQERLRKQYEVRLTVVAGQMFAARIDAESDRAAEDWRSDYDHLAYRRTEVPVTAAEPIRRLMKTLGLRYGALDFVVDHDDRWVFLEVNPGGQWGWIEHHTGLPISAAIANDLIEGDRLDH